MFRSSESEHTKTPKTTTTFSYTQLLSDVDVLENFHKYRQSPEVIEIFLIAPSVDFLGLDNVSLPRAPCRRRCPSRERGPSL